MLLNAVFNHTIYKDWFLPSKDELYLMYTELKAHSIGGFSNDVYQSSSEKDASNAWGYLFLNGASTFDYKTTTRSARACRTFTSTATYALRDIGPAGGYIFYASSGTYYEAARGLSTPPGEFTSVEWSDPNASLLGTNTAVGTGKANTATIVAALLGHETGRAAQLCAALSIQV